MAVNARCFYISIKYLIVDTRFINIIILGSYVAGYFVLQGMWSNVLKYDTYSLKARCNALLGAVAQYAANQTRNTGASLFNKCTGFFYVSTQHTGPRVLCPIRDEASWLSVLLKDTSLTRLGDSNPHCESETFPQHFHNI